MTEMLIPQIDVGQLYFDSLNSQEAIAYPVDGAIWQLQRQDLGVLEEILYTNKLLISIFQEAKRIPEKDSQYKGVELQLKVQEVIFHARRIIDCHIACAELIGKRRQDGRYPDALTADSIGDVLKKLEERPPAPYWLPFEPHKKVLNFMNELSNAHKHHVLTYQFLMDKRPRPEPAVVYLSGRNKQQPHDVKMKWTPLRKLIEAVSSLLRDVREHHRELTVSLGCPNWRDIVPQAHSGRFLYADLYWIQTATLSGAVSVPRQERAKVDGGLS